VLTFEAVIAFIAFEALLALSACEALVALSANDAVAVGLKVEAKSAIEALVALSAKLAVTICDAVIAVSAVVATDADSACEALTIPVISLPLPSNEPLNDPLAPLLNVVVFPIVTVEALSTIDDDAKWCVPVPFNK